MVHASTAKALVLETQEGKVAPIQGLQWGMTPRQQEQLVACVASKAAIGPVQWRIVACAWVDTE